MICGFELRTAKVHGPKSTNIPSYDFTVKKNINF